MVHYIYMPGESIEEAKERLKQAVMLILEDRLEDVSRGLPAGHQRKRAVNMDWASFRPFRLNDPPGPPSCLTLTGAFASAAANLVQPKSLLEGTIQIPGSAAFLTSLPR